MSVIQAKKLAKTFVGENGELNKVVEALSFEIKGPAVVGFLGANGVGKSVSMRILAGLVEPDSGSVLVDGQPANRCRRGFVPASNPVYGWRRAIDDIGIGLEADGMKKDERRSLVSQFMRQFSIDLPLQRRTCRLSSGQKQMVAVARALVGPVPPPLLVLDEPWASLSPLVRDELLQYLEWLRQNSDTVVFLSAHTIDSAILACDWILPLKERPIRATQEDLIEVKLPRPRNASSRQSRVFRDLLERIEGVFHGLPAVPV